MQITHANNSPCLPHQCAAAVLGLACFLTLGSRQVNIQRGRNPGSPFCTAPSSPFGEKSQADNQAGSSFIFTSIRHLSMRGATKQSHKSQEVGQGWVVLPTSGLVSRLYSMHGMFCIIQNDSNNGAFTAFFRDKRTALCPGLERSYAAQRYLLSRKNNAHIEGSNLAFPQKTMPFLMDAVMVPHDRL